MIPLRLRATNYGPYPDLDVVFEEGCTGILGEIRGGPAGVTSNGAGKSHLLNAIPAVLFGSLDEAKFSDLLTNDSGGVDLMLELTFSHQGETYRVRRGYSAKTKAGKSTLDLEVSVHDVADIDHEVGWAPLTGDSIAATQQAIDDLLGLSRDTFFASAIMVQDHPSFASKTVGRVHRFALLSEGLGLDEYDAYKELARRDRANADADIAALDGRIRVLEESAAATADLDQRREAAAQAAADAQAGAAAAETLAAAEQAYLAEAKQRANARAAAASNVAALQAEVAGRDQIIDRAKAAAPVIAAAAQEIERLDPVAAALPGLQAEIQAARTAQAHRDAEQRERDTKGDEADRLDRQVTARAGERDQLVAKAAEILQQADALVAETQCRECQRPLEAAVEQARASMRAEADQHRQRAADLNEQILDDIRTVNQLRAEAKAPLTVEILHPDRLADLEQRHNQATDAGRELAVQRERLSTAEAQKAEATVTVYADQARLTQELAAAREALAAFDNDPPANLPALEAQAAQAVRAAEDARVTLTAAASEVARVDAQIEQAEKAAADLHAARLQLQDAQATRGLAATMERLYGRDGIPKTIIENVALPYLEQESTRILQRLGLSYEVQLRTEQANKTTDGTRAVLDVVVVKDNAVEQPYHLFSGGEETRINYALQIALARLLRNRKGAGVEVLALDEPKFLDAAGMTQLVELLRDLEGEFPVILLISHVAELRDAFDQVIEVVRENGRSRIAGAAVDAELAEVAA